MLHYVRSGPASHNGRSFFRLEWVESHPVTPQPGVVRLSTSTTAAWLSDQITWSKFLYRIAYTFTWHVHVNVQIPNHRFHHFHYRAWTWNKIKLQHAICNIGLGLTLLADVYACKRVTCWLAEVMEVWAQYRRTIRTMKMECTIRTVVGRFNYIGDYC